MEFRKILWIPVNTEFVQNRIPPELFFDRIMDTLGLGEVR